MAMLHIRISIDGNTADTTIKKIINMQQEKIMTKNGTLKKTNVLELLLRRFPTENHPMPSATET